MTVTRRYEASSGSLSTVAEHVVHEGDSEIADVRREGGPVGVRLAWYEGGLVRFRMTKTPMRTGSWTVHTAAGEEIGTIRHRAFTSTWDLTPTRPEAPASARVRRLGRARGPVQRGGTTVAEIDRTTPWTRLVFTRRRTWQLTFHDRELAADRTGLGALVSALPIALDHRERSQHGGDTP